MRATRLIPFIALAIIVSPIRWSWSANPPKRVLLLGSFGRNVAPVSTVISAFRTSLTSRSANPIELHEVSLEMARFTHPGEEASFANFLHTRFSEKKPDLLVCVGGPAFLFFNKYRGSLFPGTPVLISDVAEQIIAGRIPGNAALVAMPVDLQGLLHDIMVVLPRLKNVAVILGASPFEKFWVKECRREFAAFAHRINFIYLNQLPFEEIKDRVASLPPKSAIFFGYLIIDQAGVSLDPGEAIRSIIENANAPVFALHETFFGDGIVGGHLMQGHAAGEKTAEVALKILNGETASNFKVVLPNRQHPIYDDRALKRWSINAKNLPQGSLIKFRQPSTWDRYRWHILGIVAFVILQSFLIGRLLVQIHRRNIADREREESEKKLNLIANSLPVLIGYVDSNHRYRFMNDTHRVWFGADPEAALGSAMSEVVGERFYQAVLPQVTQALSGKKVHFNQTVELGGDRILTMESVYIPDIDDSGTVHGFYLLIMDVSELKRTLQESKRLHDELLHADRVTAMGELAGALAHEINQPLSAIMSNAQAARRYLAASSPDLEEVKEILPDIAEEADRAGKIIYRLKAFLKKNETIFEPIDLNRLIEEVVGFLNSDAVIRNIRVCTEFDRRIPQVMGDRIQLQQVVLNVISNAFDAIQNQGRQSCSIRIRTRRTGGGVLTSISDNGSGISEGEIENVFHPYFTTKPHGLGMGLSISRHIVSRHNGRIWAENNAGAGATFFFALPVDADERRRTEKNKSSEPV